MYVRSHVHSWQEKHQYRQIPAWKSCVTQYHKHNWLADFCSDFHKLGLRHRVLFRPEINVQAMWASWATHVQMIQKSAAYTLDFLNGS